MEPTMAFARPRHSSGGLWLIIPIIPGIQRELSNRDGLLAPEPCQNFLSLFKRPLIDLEALPSNRGGDRDATPILLYALRVRNILADRIFEIHCSS